LAETNLIYTTLAGAGPEISVATTGSGPAMVLLHGLGSSGRSWLPVLSALVPRFRLVIPDLRGHGNSGHPPNGYLPDNYADDLERVVEFSADPRPILVGSSLGGLVAMTWAKRHPDRARAIALEDVPLTGGIERVRFLDESAELAAMPVPDVIARYETEHPDWTPEDCAARAAIVTSTDPMVFHELREMAVSAGSIDYLEGLGSVTTPMLLIHGDIDTGGMVTATDAARFAGLGPKFRAVRIAGGSHALHRERTADFLHALFDFLDGA
jgi:pimeloyl-ACP methyl ester carboxylesterase